MPRLYNISEWNEQPWLNTGGTRNKKIYLNPADNELYYFKQSLKKDKKDYKYEFWSEIIAYEIGQMCGFDILPYHVAVRGSQVGCISKSMINPDKEELVEGGRYIQAFDTTFNPDDRSLRHQYTFELIIASLASLNLSKYYNNLVEVLVFDALIGNSDRHQENWAFINSHSAFSRSMAEFEHTLEHQKVLENSPKIIRSLLQAIYMVQGKLRPEYKRIRLSLPKETRFSPIYDSGCSFGRELMDERVVEMIKNPSLIEKYTKKGESEIHWQGKKVSHFALLDNLLKEQEFKQMVETPIKRIINKFDEKKLNELISEVDVDLPEDCESFKIPSERKQLICKLVLSRFNLLKALF
jgi:hypothetical protein